MKKLAFAVFLFIGFLFLVSIKAPKAFALAGVAQVRFENNGQIPVTVWYQFYYNWDPGNQSGIPLGSQGAIPVPALQSRTVTSFQSVETPAYAVVWSTNCTDPPV